MKSLLSIIDDMIELIKCHDKDEST